MESNRQSSSVIYHNYSKCENSNCCFIVNSTHWETSSIWTSINTCPSCSYCDSKRVYDDQIFYHLSYKFTFTKVNNTFIIENSIPPSLVADLVRPWSPNQCLRPRMWYVGASMPNEAHSSRKVFILLYSCTPGFLGFLRFSRQKCLLLVTNKSLCRVLIKEAILV